MDRFVPASSCKPTAVMPPIWKFACLVAGCGQMLENPFSAMFHDVYKTFRHPPRKTDDNDNEWKVTTNEKKNKKKEEKNERKKKLKTYKGEEMH